MLQEQEILMDAEKHVTEMITRDIPKTRYFHGLAHTQTVVFRSYEIARFYQIPDEQMLILRLAAWFHDVGYCMGSEDHEHYSAQIMRNHCESILPEHQIADIHRIILSTKLSTDPGCLLEEIICDADLYHLGSHQYEKWAMLLKKEVEHYHHVTIPQEAWMRENIGFFVRHKYFTGYANYHWNPQKEINLSEMKEKLKLMC